jgi:hypothetical protein|tara:strand:+ start:1553 stop:1900 length:348 start_codon:yes stop_codon:yes gene_type:complete
MENNSNKVFVVQVDHNKDMSDAKKYGQLQAVFGNPRKPYDTHSMVNKAREILEDWSDGDYLLMLGDPTLCGVCMAVTAEFTDSVNILSWDRNSFSYIPQQWEFGQSSQRTIHTAD